MPDPGAPLGSRACSPAGSPYLLRGRRGREHAVLSQPLPVTAAPRRPLGSSDAPRLARPDPARGCHSDGLPRRWSWP